MTRFSALSLAILGGLAQAWAQSGPRPPCGGEAVPAIPSLGDSPAVKLWSPAETGAKWRPPECTGWTGEGFSTLVTTAGRFRHAGGVEELLAASGAVSSLAGVRYWSTTHQAWRTLIEESYAVSTAQGDGRRKDFTPDELKPGAVLYFRQVDNLTGKAVYRLHIAEYAPGRLVFDVSNVTPVRYLIVTIFHVGEMQSIYYLEREGEDVWRYYSMVRTGKGASGLTAGHDASWINRSVAYYRHVAGIPTDQEPPAAR